MSLNLTDEREIKQAEKTTVKEVETLYWILEDALYDGRMHRAQSTFQSFLYLGKYRKDLIANGLQPIYRERLKEIAHELHGSSVHKKRSAVQIKRPISPTKLPFDKESELEEFLVDHPEILSQALEDDIDFVDRQVETDFEYRCDIVARSSKRFYPIELKIGQADHVCVSQCNKYCFYFFRKLRYDRYRDIQGVVCAPGFDSWSINELRRERIWCFLVRPAEKNITLERIP